jgi:hypothetical protein
VKVSLTATFLPPPHLSRAGAQPERLAKEVSSEVVGSEIDAVVHHAEDAGLFAAGGCVNVVIQRVPARPPQGPGQ